MVRLLPVASASGPCCRRRLRASRAIRSGHSYYPAGTVAALRIHRCAEKRTNAFVACRSGAQTRQQLPEFSRLAAGTRSSVAFSPSELRALAISSSCLAAAGLQRATAARARVCVRRACYTDSAASVACAADLVVVGVVLEKHGGRNTATARGAGGERCGSNGGSGTHTHTA